MRGGTVPHAIRRRLWCSLRHLRGRRCRQRWNDHFCAQSRNANGYHKSLASAASYPQIVAKALLSVEANGSVGRFLDIRVDGRFSLCLEDLGQIC
jgi:hypothetical protein